MPTLRMNAVLLAPLLALAACGGSTVEPVSSSASAASGSGGGGGTGSLPPGASTVDTIAPSTPTNLVATVAGSTGATLTWTASTDNVGVTGYVIRRNGASVGTSTANNFADATLSPVTTYTFTVAARDAAGNASAQSASASVTTEAAGPPPAPSPPPLAGTALGTLAASMAPGTWAQLSVSNENAVLGVGGVSGTMIHFSNSMPWNPFSKVIEIIGMDHNWPAGLRHVRFDVATNSFVFIEDGIDGTNIAHGYDHNTLNPNTGDIYHRVYSGFTGTISSKVERLGVTGFVSIPSVSASDQVAIGTSYWSGPFIGGGAQGSFMIFNSGNAIGNSNDGQILAYDPVKNTWFFNKEGMAPNYGGGATYHSVMEYSAIKNVAVYGGGDAAPTKLWRLNANGSFTVMPNTPGVTEVGIQRGNLVNDPVSGNFLLLSSGQLWELNPDGAGTWTQLASPPAGVGDPGFPTAVISSSISDYGVVAYITQPSQTGGTFYLYKRQ
jgi:chitodextrinase